MFRNNLNLFFTVIAASTTIFLGFLVYLHDKKSATNRIFIIHSFVASIWAVVNFFSLVASPDSVLFWIRGVIFLAVPHLFLFFLFVKNFPNSNLSISKLTFSGIIILMFLMMVLAFTPWAFSSINISGNQVTPVPGKLMPVFSMVLITFFILTFGLIIQKYFHTLGLIKRQWLTIGIGLLISYSLLIFLVFIRVILFEDIRFVPYSPLFVLPIFFGAAYAIFRHQLFNVKVIATEIFTFFLLVISFVQIFLAQTKTASLISLFTSISFLIIGILLIRSVLKEVQQREKLEALTKELEIKNEELKKLDEAKSEFVSITSHQLRTPLSTIKGYVSMILEGLFGPVSKKVKPILERVYDSNERLITLVRNLLNVSRIESGRIQYEKTYIDLIDLLVGVGEDVSGEIKKKGLDLKIQHVHKKLPRIFADSSYLRQVFLNLIDNAAKYTQKGTIKINFDIIEEGPPDQFSRAGDLRDMVVVSVKDTGMGMNEAELNSIFRKFTRGETSRKYFTEGLGLGLFVAKEITEAHGGKIWAESEGKGKGSAFFVALPLRPSEEN